MRKLCNDFYYNSDPIYGGSSEDLKSGCVEIISEDKFFEIPFAPLSRISRRFCALFAVLFYADIGRGGARFGIKCISFVDKIFSFLIFTL
jgi:hypothetical protein